MKNKIMLALALGMSFNAVADEMASNSGTGFYAGGFYSGETASMDQAEDSNFGTINLQLGYQINEFFSIEARYGVGVKGESESWDEDIYVDYNTYVSMDVKVEADIDSQFSLLAKGTYPMSDVFSLYGFAAYSNTKIGIDSTARVASLNISESDSVSYSDSGLGLGVGVDYKLNDSFKVFFEYQMYPKFSIEGEDLDLDAANLGVTYKF